MPTLTLTDEQVIELVRQLAADRQVNLLTELATRARAGQEERMRYAQEQMRRLCAERGLDWDTMDEEAREAFVDDLVHEDRKCCR